MKFAGTSAVAKDEVSRGENFGSLKNIFATHAKIFAFPLGSTGRSKRVYAQTLWVQGGY